MCTSISLISPLHSHICLHGWSPPVVRVIRLSGNSTPGGQSVTSNGAGESPAEAIIRLLFGDVCDWAGPFLNSRKTVTWPPENRGSVSP